MGGSIYAISHGRMGCIFDLAFCRFWIEIVLRDKRTSPSLGTYVVTHSYMHLAQTRSFRFIEHVLISTSGRCVFVLRTDPRFRVLYLFVHFTLIQAYIFSAAERNPKKACLTVTDEDNAELSKCDVFNPIQQFQAVRIYTEDTTNPVLLLMSVSTKFRLLIPQRHCSFSLSFNRLSLRVNSVKFF